MQPSSANRNHTTDKGARRRGFAKNDYRTNQTTDDNAQSDDFSIDERDEQSIEEESKTDTSELTGLNSLTNTYMS